MGLAASACGAAQMEPVMLERLAARAAYAARVHVLDLDGRLRSQGVVFAQDVPREVERLGVHLRHVADTQQNRNDARSTRLARRSHHHVKNSRNQAEFMHGQTYSSSSSSENRLMRRSVRPFLPSRATMTMRVTNSEIS